MGADGRAVRVRQNNKYYDACAAILRDGRTERDLFNFDDKFIDDINRRVHKNMKFSDVTLSRGEIYSRRTYDSKKDKFLAEGVRILQQLSATGVAFDASTGLKFTRAPSTWWPAGKISSEALSELPFWTVSFRGEDLHFAMPIRNFELPANWEEDCPAFALATISTLHASCTDSVKIQLSVAKEILEMRPVSISALAPFSVLRLNLNDRKIQQAYQDASRVSLHMSGAYFENPDLLT